MIEGRGNRYLESKALSSGVAVGDAPRSNGEGKDPLTPVRLQPIHRALRVASRGHSGSHRTGRRDSRAPREPICETPRRRGPCRGAHGARFGRSSTAKGVLPHIERAVPCRRPPGRAPRRIRPVEAGGRPASHAAPPPDLPRGAAGVDAPPPPP